MIAILKYWTGSTDIDLFFVDNYNYRQDIGHQVVGLSNNFSTWQFPRDASLVVHINQAIIDLLSISLYCKNIH